MIPNSINDLQSAIQVMRDCGKELKEIRLTKTKYDEFMKDANTKNGRQYLKLHKSLFENVPNYRFRIYE